MAFNDFDDQLKRRIALAREQGWKEDEIQRSALIEKTLHQKQQVAQQQVQPKQSEKKPSGWKKFLVNAGAFLGSAALGVGSAVAAPVTGGASLAAGFAGGAGIEALRRKLLGEKQNLGASALEGGLTIIPGIGKGLKALKGVKAAETAVEAGRGAKAAQGAIAEKEALKDVILKGFKTSEEGGRLTKVSRNLKKTGTGAVDLKEGFRAIPNANARLATIEKYGIKSGRRGLGQGTEALADLESRLQPILKNTKISVKDVENILKNVSGLSEAEITDPLMQRIIKGQTQAIRNAAKDGVISGDEFRSIRSSVGNGIFKGAETGAKDFKKEIYKAYGDLIGSKAPKARDILGEQHLLLDLEKGLAKKSEGARVPFFGTAFKSQTAGRVRDTATDVAAGLTGKIGKVTANPVVKAGIQQSIARSLTKPYIQEQPQNQGLPADVNQVFAPPQTEEEAIIQDLVQSGAGDFDTVAKGISDYQAQPQLSSPGMESPQNGLSVGSSELFNQALQAWNAGDAKGAKAIMDFAQIAADFEAANAKNAGGSGVKLSDTAIKTLGDLQGGLSDIDNLEATLKANPGVTGNIGGLKAFKPFGFTLDENAAQVQAQIDRVKQVIGKALEGGVLRKEDEEKYKKILPTIRDPQSVALYKLQELRRKLTEDMNTYSGLQQNYGKGSTDIANLFTTDNAFNTQGAY